MPELLRTAVMTGMRVMVQMVGMMMMNGGHQMMHQSIMFMVECLRVVMSMSMMQLK